MSFDPEAAARVRRLLSGRDDVVERKMVGGLSFLVNGNMCCGVTGTALMIRVGADGREQALREPHVRPMLLGGRVLSGFICIEPAGYAADDALASWVRRGLDFAPVSRLSLSARAADRPARSPLPAASARSRRAVPGPRHPHHRTGWPTDDQRTESAQAEVLAAVAAP